MDIDPALVGCLVLSQFPEWAGLTVELVLPHGTDNALFRLGEDLVARFPRTRRAAGILAKERRWLPRLAPRLPFCL